MDNSSFRKKYMLGLLSSASVLWTVVGGITGFLAGVVFSSALLKFLGVAGFVIGVGNFLTRLLKGDEQIARKAQQEVEQESNLMRDGILARLEEDLACDDDPRTQQALRDLRVLSDAFKKSSSWHRKIDAETIATLQTKVKEIFGECVKSLETSLEIYTTLDQGVSERVKTAMQRRRTQIITKVINTIDNLAETLAGFQELSLSEDPGARLTELGEELSNQLEAAKEQDQQGRQDAEMQRAARKRARERLRQPGLK